MLYFNQDGAILKEGTLVVSPDNRGFRYGDGLFETVKMLDGEIVQSDDHFARLWKGMQVLQFDIPKLFSPEKFTEQFIALAKKNNHSNAARIRLNIFRGDGGLFDAKNHTPNYIIQTWPLQEGNGQWNSNGLVAGIYDDAKKSCDILSNLKHNNFLPYVMAALHAKKEKWNDAILLNTDGKICDTCIANIFLVKDEVVFTPALSQGCVAGVMRHSLIQFLQSTAWKVEEKAIAIEELLTADEVFFTNSIYNLRWVQSIGKAVYGNSFTQKIYAAFNPTIS